MQPEQDIEEHPQDYDASADGEDQNMLSGVSEAYQPQQFELVTLDENENSSDPIQLPRPTTAHRANMKTKIARSSQMSQSSESERVCTPVQANPPGGPGTPAEVMFRQKDRARVLVEKPFDGIPTPRLNGHKRPRGTEDDSRSPKTPKTATGLRRSVVKAKLHSVPHAKSANFVTPPVKTMNPQLNKCSPRPTKRKPKIQRLSACKYC